MKRFLAILGAVVMILVAVLIRGAMDDDSPFDRSGGKDRPSAAKPKLLCATELTDVCKAIEDAGIATVSVADSGTTIDLLAKERTANFDLWLTAGPWDQILADNLSFSKKSPSTPLLGTPGPIVARSPVIAVTLEQSATQRATAACPDGIALSCASSDPTLKVGVASPRRGDGLAVLSQAVANRMAAVAKSESRPYSGFDTNDLQSDDLRSWIPDLADTSTKARLGKNTPLYVALTKKAVFQLVGALEAEASDLLGDRQGPKVTYPQPIVTADVRLIPRNEVEIHEVFDDDEVALIKRTLAAEGWRVDGAKPPGVANAPDLPDGDGLADPGVLSVLRQTWGKGG